jgi:hypothetical protein
MVSAIKTQRQRATKNIAVTTPLQLQICIGLILVHFPFDEPSSPAIDSRGSKEEMADINQASVQTVTRLVIEIHHHN